MRDLTGLLERLLNLPGENEVVEFKKAQNGFDTQKLGEYFSALSNEANLHERACAWLLFGIDDKTHTVLGTCYKPTYASLQALKREVAEGINGGMTFTEIHSLQYEGKRVLLFEKYRQRPERGCTGRSVSESFLGECDGRIANG